MALVDLTLNQSQKHLKDSSYWFQTERLASRHWPRSTLGDENMTSWILTQALIVKEL
jgi:hypothetical protein